VAPHTHTKDLLKLYLLLNYDISDNHSIGQGKIIKKKKTKQTNKKNTKNKKQKKLQICLLVTSVQADPWSFLASFKGFPVPSEGGSRQHPGFALSPMLVREVPGCWCKTVHLNGWV